MKFKSSQANVIAAIPTPFLPDGSVNVIAYVSLAKKLLSCGCSGLNLMGTTGEATSLSTAERLQLMQDVANSELQMDKLIVGTGSSSISDAITLTKSAGEFGFSGALLLPPYYYKEISDEGIINYISQVVDATQEHEIPILLYNFPSLSGVSYNLDVIEELVFRHGDRIAGLKDSSNDIEYCKKAAKISEKFAVFPSNESSLLFGKEFGFAGCISATATINSNLCSEALENSSSDLIDKAVAIRDIYSGLPLVAAVKYTVSSITSDSSWQTMRPPLVSLSNDQQDLLKSRFVNLDHFGIEEDLNI